MDSWRGLANRTVKTRILVDNENLQSRNVLSDDELPILEYYENEFNFLIFTTSSIYYKHGSINISFKYNDIKLIDSNNDFIRLKEAPDFIDFKLILSDNSRINFKVETGAPFKAMILLISWHKNL
ncbi:hypothetical protein [Tenacibaculum skagerrakense]|nr:hypothetical protein [Tenacibaculum skagerrakense]